jgi:hypothetical protein
LKNLLHLVRGLRAGQEAGSSPVRVIVEADCPDPDAEVERRLAELEAAGRYKPGGLVVVRRIVSPGNAAAEAQ